MSHKIAEKNAYYPYVDYKGDAVNRTKMGSNKTKKNCFVRKQRAMK